MESASDHDIELAREIAPAIFSWFGANARTFPWRGWTDPYRVTVAEMLLQRTRAEVVSSYVEGFVRRYPSWLELDAAPMSQLEEDLQSLGLQHRRARSFKSIASLIKEGHEGDLGSLPGVGQYIGRAVAVAIHHERVAMVDANFVRVIRRVFGGPWKADYRYDARLQRIASVIVETCEDPALANWSVLDFGAVVCKPRSPKCDECPIASHCLFLRTG